MLFPWGNSRMRLSKPRSATRSTGCLNSELHEPRLTPGFEDRAVFSFAERSPILHLPCELDILEDLGLFGQWRQDKISHSLVCIQWSAVGLRTAERVGDHVQSVARGSSWS
jgi:hypothetical protein